MPGWRWVNRGSIPGSVIPFMMLLLREIDVGDEGHEGEDAYDVDDDDEKEEEEEERVLTKEERIYIPPCR